jgi:hypothetical protein
MVALAAQVLATIFSLHVFPSHEHAVFDEQDAASVWTGHASGFCSMV